MEFSLKFLGIVYFFFSLLLFTVSSNNVSGQALPEFVCQRRKAKFIRYGCTQRESLYCNALVRTMTREILGAPACLFYPCEGYDNPEGYFLCNATCNDGTEDIFGMCAGNDICCLT